MPDLKIDIAFKASIDYAVPLIIMYQHPVINYYNHRIVINDAKNGENGEGLKGTIKKICFMFVCACM